MKKYTLLVLVAAVCLLTACQGPIKLGILGGGSDAATQSETGTSAALTDTQSTARQTEEIPTEEIPTEESLATTCEESTSAEQHLCTFLWQADDEGHRQECACGAKQNAAAHEFGDSGAVLPTLTLQGYSSGVQCAVCLYVAEGEHVLPAFETTCGSHAYKALAAEEKGDQLQRLYRTVYEGCAAVQEDGSLDATKTDMGLLIKTLHCESVSLTAEEMNLVLRAVKDDCPIFYWLSAFSLKNGSEVSLYVEEPYVSGQLRMACTRAIYEGIIALSHRDTHDYETLLRLHDAIVERMTYAYEADGITPSAAPSAHNLDGYFSSGTGVCEAYAEVFQAVLNYMGIDCMTVTGLAQGERHAWNLVQLDDGRLYWFDLTWDDQPSRPMGRMYDYFCKTDAGFAMGERQLDERFTYLPARATSDYAGTATPVGGQLTAEGMSFTVVGYRQVELNTAAFAQEVTVPETVTWEGRSYSVVSLGNEQQGVLHPVFASGTASVTLPATVAYLRGNALSVYTLREVSIAADNPHFETEGGVAVYRKGEQTLVCLLMGSGASSFALRPGTVGIEQWAILQCYGLQTLSLPHSLQWIEAYGVYMCEDLIAILFDGTDAQWQAVFLGEQALPAEITVTTK